MLSKLRFGMLVILLSMIVQARVNISEVVNNTTYDLTLIFSESISSLKIIGSKTTMPNNSHNEAAGEGKSIITIPAQTVISLAGAFIPDADMNLKSGVKIVFGSSDATPLNPIGMEETKFSSALIRQKGEDLQLALVENGHQEIMYQTNIAHGPFNQNQGYILEVNGENVISLYPRTQEKIDSYFNHNKLHAQQLLHQGIMSELLDDMREALKLGANLDKGIGDQPPLLLAVISNKESAALELLRLGANPSIQYSGRSLLWHIFHKNNYKLAHAYLMKKPKLTESEKQEMIDYILFRSSYRFDQLAIDILKILGYNIKDNFDSADISTNKWYQLLIRHFMGHRQDKPFGHAGLPAEDLVSLFLKNGANPNQIFHGAKDTKWTPLLLLMDNYIGMENKLCNPNQIYNLIQILLKAGADINLKAACLPNNKDASPLSYLLKFEDSNCVIDLLVKLGANIADAVQLYINDGGELNKKFRFWQKSGSWNLLLWAVENNSPEAVKLLVQSGASKDQSALQLAISRGYGEVIKILMP